MVPSLFNSSRSLSVLVTVRYNYAQMGLVNEAVQGSLADLGQPEQGSLGISPSRIV